MEILTQDSSISNDDSKNVSPANNSTTNDKSATPKLTRPTRKQMIKDLLDYKNEIASKNKFKRGSAYNLTNLFLKLSNLNFSLYNIKSLSDSEVFAMWQDIKSNK